MSGLKPLSSLVVLLLIPIAVIAQEVSYPPEFDEPFDLYTKALGDFERPISSNNKMAQSYFNQGFQMMYAFAKEDGARSFREAWKNDPECAICYWGEAWAWGSYLNGPMRKEEAPRAYAAIRKAVELANKGHASEKEEAFIEAMSVRYVEDYDPDTKAVQDTAYAMAMKEVAEKYPNDLDAATFYAEALFLMEPRRGNRDINDPDVQKLHQVLEEILAKDIKHPGACHLYIHATESTTRPEKAEACAEFIGTSIPGASHINHMPSHTWNQVGRWGDGVKSNIMAWHSDQKAAVGEGFAIYPSHNLHMLLFAGSMDGQGGIATQAGRDYAKLTGNNMYEVLTLIRFGRFSEVLKVTEKPTQDIPLGMWHFSQGYAQLKEGDTDLAKYHLLKVTALADSSKRSFRGHSAKHLLSIVGGILKGEIETKEGNTDQAIATLEQSVAYYDSLQYDEPEPLPFSPRHWLGAALIADGQFTKAEQVYRDELKDHPHNGWSLFGLQQALEGQGKSDPEVDADFEASWARSDTWIRGSKF